jgi:hypothetical protein
VLGVMLAATFVRSLVRAVPIMRKLFRAHSLPPALMGLLVAGAALGLLLLLAVTIGAAYASLIRPARLAKATRYFVTNARVLICRGHEELHLDRKRIAYVIDAPSKGLHDVFLVLDGPQARALAPSGAFDVDDAGVLRPVFAKIHDAEEVESILRTERESLPRAA